MDNGGDLYFAESPSGAIKVGRSSNVAGRIEQLRCPDGERVRLVSSLRGMGMYEKTVHRALKEDSLGHEWFTGSASVMRLVRAQSGEELLRLLGVKRRDSAPWAGSMTDKDRADVAEADRLIREGRKLRNRVMARIRVRRHRASKASEVTE